jgi:uncharacterized cupredoxin-like copper-binding protein
MRKGSFGAALAASMAVAFVLGVAGASVAVAKRLGATPVAVQHVTVVMTDFHFKLSVRSVKHGVPIIFTVINKGRVVHNFDLQEYKATAIVGHGKTRVIRLTIPEKGNTPYICDVPRHADLGMGGQLVVR